MGYTSETIATTIKKLNEHYLLPAIQREFVWEPAQVVKLFDSIMRGYPIGSFLFWHLDDANRHRWEAYEFLDHVYEGGTHNELANTDGMKSLSLVLDGQQRLTSLNVGLRGDYAFKRKWGRRKNPDTWSRKKLYLDLFRSQRDPDEDDAEAGIYYGFHWLDPNPTSAGAQYWFPVGRILEFETQDTLDDFKDTLTESLPDMATKQQERTLRNNLDRLFRAVYKDEVIAYYPEKEQDYDRVLDIFVRANAEGAKLTKSDLLLSMVTSKWVDTNAREEIYGFVERLNTALTRRNNFSKDFVLKSCLVLTDLPVAYKVENFSNANLELIRASWPKVKKAVEEGVDFVNSRGIDESSLTSANALIPIFYFLHKCPEVRLRGTSAQDHRNASLVRRWLCTALLNNVFGGSSDTLLTSLRDAIQTELQSGRTFPAKALVDVVTRAGRLGSFDENAVDRALELSYGGRRTFLALSLLYDEAAWGTMTFHQDHIFPKSRFTNDLKGTDREEWLDMKDQLGNLCLLQDAENEEKSNRSFEDWITTRSPDFKSHHLIPTDQNLYAFDRFADFLQAREDLIRSRLLRILELDAAP